MTAVDALLERLAPRGPRDAVAAASTAWLHANGLPSRRDEAWRYTPVDRILTALDVAQPAPRTSHEISRAHVTALAGSHGHRVVFVNGSYAPELSDRGTAPVGLSWDAAAAAADFAADDRPADGLDALNAAATPGVAALRVAPGVRIDEPIHLVHVTTAERDVSVANPRLVVTVGEGAVVSIVESYVGAGDALITNASTRLVACDSSTLTYHRLQAEPPAALHVGHTRVDQFADSRVHASSVQLGGAVARSAIDVRLRGTNAMAEIDGLYAPSGRQWHDNPVTVEHAAPRCSSTQRFHGIIDDHARGSFSGHVIVRAGAAGTDAEQTNRNLLLCSTAQADTRPWLEILADDVRCAHGATVGRLDEAALFYLRSRGISRAESRAMLVGAFAADIVGRLAPASLREQVAAAFGPRGGREQP